MSASRENYGRAIEALHSTARSFMRAETGKEVADVAVEAIREILDMPNNGVFLYDETVHRLRPVAWTAEGEHLVGSIPTFGPGDGLAWEVFDSGDPEIYDDVAAVDGRFNPDTPVGSEIILPLDDHGVLMIGSAETGAFDGPDVSLAKTVAAHMTTALDRIEREQKLRRQNARFDEFASVVSHDLLGPLNVAKGRLELVRDEYESEHLDSAIAAIQRSLDLVDDLRSLTRIGEPVSDPDTVELGEIADACWQHVRTGDATLVVDTERTIRADRGRLQQLVENVFRNAVEHGGAEVTVTIGDLDEGFYIADDGPGISEEDRRQVFESGYSTKESGTGFGLSIIREITEAHDWDVRLTDSEAGGLQIEFSGIKTVPTGG